MEHEEVMWRYRAWRIARVETLQEKNSDQIFYMPRRIRMFLLTIQSKYFFHDSSSFTLNSTLFKSIIFLVICAFLCTDYL